MKVLKIGGFVLSLKHYTVTLYLIIGTFAFISCSQKGDRQAYNGNPNSPTSSANGQTFNKNTVITPEFISTHQSSSATNRSANIILGEPEVKTGTRSIVTDIRDATTTNNSVPYNLVKIGGFYGKNCFMNPDNSTSSSPKWFAQFSRSPTQKGKHSGRDVYTSSSESATNTTEVSVNPFSDVITTTAPGCIFNATYAIINIGDANYLYKISTKNTQSQNGSQTPYYEIKQFFDKESPLNPASASGDPLWDFGRINTNNNPLLNATLSICRTPANCDEITSQAANNSVQYPNSSNLPAGVSSEIYLSGVLYIGTSSTSSGNTPGSNAAPSGGSCSCCCQACNVPSEGNSPSKPCATIELLLAGSLNTSESITTTLLFGCKTADGFLYEIPAPNYCFGRKNVCDSSTNLMGSFVVKPITNCSGTCIAEASLEITPKSTTAQTGEYYIFIPADALTCATPTFQIGNTSIPPDISKCKYADIDAIFTSYTARSTSGNNLYKNFSDSKWSTNNNSVFSTNTKGNVPAGFNIISSTYQPNFSHTLSDKDLKWFFSSINTQSPGWNFLLYPVNTLAEPFRTIGSSPEVSFSSLFPLRSHTSKSIIVTTQYLIIVHNNFNLNAYELMQFSVAGTNSSSYSIPTPNSTPNPTPNPTPIQINPNYEPISR